MRLRNIPGADDAILNSEYCIKNPEEQKGHWQDCFDKVQPLHIEIGMGKGRFIMDMAALHPDINYIGIERYSSVLLRALQKMEQNPLPNILHGRCRCCRGFRQRRSRPYLLKLLRSLAERPPRQETSHFQTIFCPL